MYIAFRLCLFVMVGCLAIAEVAGSAAHETAPAKTEWTIQLEGAARERPECVSWGEGRIDCLIRVKTGAMRWLAFSDGVWQSARNLGGDITGPAACVVRGAFGLNCFARTRAARLGHITLNGPTWSGWSDLGPQPIAGTPSCIAGGRDRIGCFARDPSGRLLQRLWNGAETWEPWRDWGGELASDPSCISLGLDRYSCFAVSTGAALVTLWPATDGPGNAWIEIGGEFSGSPACGRDGKQIRCLLKAKDGQAFEWTGALDQRPAKNVGLRRLEQMVKDGPVCASKWPEGGLRECVIISGSGTLMRWDPETGGGSAFHFVPAPAFFAARCLSPGAGKTACLGVDTERRLHSAWLGADTLGRQAKESATAASPFQPKPAPTAEATAASAPPNLTPAAPSSPVAATPVPQSAPVASSTPLPEPSAPAARGSWYILEITTGVGCHLRMTDRAALTGMILEKNPACRAISALDLAGQWADVPDGLVLKTARGRNLLRFQGEIESGELRTRAPAGNYALLRDRASLSALQPRSSVRTQSLGTMLLSVGPRALCTINLTGQWDLGGRLVQGAETCAGVIASASSWAMEGNALSLFDRDGMAVGRFYRVRQGLWRGRAAGRRIVLNLSSIP